MQYSKYLKAGYTMIDIGDDNMCAALSPDGKELVIVAQNFGSDRTTTVDLGKFNKRGIAVCYRTSQKENCEEVSTEDVSGGILNVTLPEYSVSTYVIDVETDMDNYMKTVEADIATPSEADVTVSDLNKFTYTGTWKNQVTTEEGAEASFKFEGNRAVIYGTKSSAGANVLVSVDDGEAKEVSLAAETTNTKAIICDTGNLTDGEHTVKIKVASGEAGKTLALSSANIVYGELTAESGTTVRKIIPFNEAMVVYFDEVMGASEYTVSYGTDKDHLDQSVKASGGKATIKGVANDTTYYLQVTDDLGGKSAVVSGMAGVQDENVLYFVNVGTQSLSTTASDEVFGAYNSILDQAYGEDDITGKNWGYIGTTNEAAYSDGDRWTSIRYSKNMKPLEYQFDVPAGTYNVTIAMLDPWKNGSRKTDILINGETKATGIIPTVKTKRVYQTTLAEDGTLSVTAQPSSGNTSQDAIISYIKITKQNDNEVSEAAPDTICTVRGIVPKLPETVKATTAAGTTIDATVTWQETDASAFDVEEGSSVTIAGVITGSDTKVEQEVKIMPTNMQYFIDCNWTDSTTYKAYNDAADLLNDSADKVYTNGSWGYVESYGNYDGNTSDTAGWYAGDNQSIRYKLPFSEAGTYEVTFGFYDWWYYKERPVALKAYQNNSEIADWGTFTINQKKMQTTKELTVDKAGEVMISVERGNADAPVLSWLMITKKLDNTALKNLLAQAASIDRTAYTAEQLAAIDAAIDQAKAQLIRSSSTQSSIDQAAEILAKAVNKESQKPSDPSDNPTDKPSGGSSDNPAQDPSGDPSKNPATPSGSDTQNPSDTVTEETQITLNAKKITMGVKEKMTLKATVTGNGKGQAVTWKSSKKSVAAVSSAGKITAKKKGTTTITATVDGKSISVKVTVKAAPKRIKVKKNVSIKKGHTYQIKVTLPKKTASYQFTYKSSKKSVAAVSADGKITAKKKGKATITIKAFNGKKATMKVKVK